MTSVMILNSGVHTKNGPVPPQKKWMKSRAEIKDEILRYLISRKPGIEKMDFVTTNEIISTLNISESLARDLCNELKNNHEVVFTEGTLLKIVDKGQAFLEFDGGHTSVYNEEQRIKKLNEEQIESIIKTNKSVLEINNFQKWVLAVSLITSLISGFIAWKALNKDDRIIIKPTPVTIKNDYGSPIKDTIIIFKNKK